MDQFASLHSESLRVKLPQDQVVLRVLAAADVNLFHLLVVLELCLNMLRCLLKIGVSAALTFLWFLSRAHSWWSENTHFFCFYG